MPYSQTGIIAFGNSDKPGSTAIRDYQAGLNAANLNTPGYVPLVLDGQYGPKTLAASKFKQPNPGIQSSTQPRNDLINYGSQLDNLTSTTDPYLDMLNKQAMTLQERITNDTMSEAEKTENKKTTAKGAKKEKAIQDIYDRYKGGLESLGIQTGLSRYAPELQQQALAGADIQENTKLADIQDQEDELIAKAKQARQDNDAATLKSTLSEIKQIKKEKQQEIQQALENKRAAFKMASDTNLMTTILDTMNTMPKAQQEAYLNNVANELGIDVTMLHGGLITAKRENAMKAAKASGSTKVKLADASSTIKSNFENIKGADGYIDPYVWEDMRDMWITNGLTLTTFKTLYKKYLNPAAPQYKDSYSTTGGTSGFE